MVAGPWLGPAIGALGSMATAGLSGGERDAGPLSIVNPMQQALIQKMQFDAARGGGDFGFGGAARQATGQVQQYMADRGVSPESGVYGGALSSAIANAASGDLQNRRSYMLGTAGLSPAVAQGEWNWDLGPTGGTGQRKNYYDAISKVWD